MPRIYFRCGIKMELNLVQITFYNGLIKLVWPFKQIRTILILRNKTNNKKRQ